MKSNGLARLSIALGWASVLGACGNELSPQRFEPPPDQGQNDEAKPQTTTTPPVSNNGTPTKGETTPASGSTSANASPSGTEAAGVASNPNPNPNAKFNVKVDGGFGSGSYAPGETVFVWSQVATTNQVALPWTGDATLLKNPGEWISSFVMPNRDVTLTANSAPQALELKVESFKGSTEVNKDVRFHFPPNMKGLVIMSHGTGGSSNYIENTETFALALALVKQGFGVLSTEAEEAAAGDLNKDGKTSWQTNFQSTNTDFKNIDLLITALEKRGDLTATTPKFALGMSNGGAFSHFLGAVADSPVASTFPKLRFKAVVSYCADASQLYKNASPKTPAAWYMCANDDNGEVSNTEAKANSKKLADAGVTTEYLENPASPLYDARFARVQGVSLEASKAIAKELRDAGYVDAKGFLAKPADEIAQEITNSQNASRFPALSSLAPQIQVRIRSQLKVLRAEHSQYSDQAQRNILFFEKFLK